MNNYDTSSTGENIELNVFYDYILASMAYDDFINGEYGNQVYKIEGNREILAYLIGDSDKPYYTKSELSKMKKAELFDLWQEYDFGYNDEFSKSEYINDILTVSIAKHYEYLNAQFNWYDFGRNISHGYFISRGYSQGDSVYIIDVGADYDVLANKESINNILWDTPIRIYLDVNGNSDFGYELIDNSYEYDVNKITENIKKLDISENAKNQIIEMLPSEPSYN